MFAGRFFPARYFVPRYFPGSAGAVTAAGMAFLEEAQIYSAHLDAVPYGAELKEER